MSQLLLHRAKSISIALLLALALAAIAALSPGSAVSPNGAAAATTPDLGTYYVFRTRDTGNPATSEQNSRCNTYFGVRSLLTLTRLNALLFSFDSNPSTGRIANQTANLLGPGFICGVPGTKGNQVDAYAYSSLPGTGIVEGTGGCNITPEVVANFPLILNCALKVKPDAAKRIDGGLITSNSLVNTINRSKSAPTGSVWTAQVIGTPTGAGGGTGTVPPDVGPETPGLDFFVTRTRDEAVSPSSPECKRAGLAGDPIGVRQVNLAVAQPDATGHVPDEPGAAVGKMTVCYAYVNRVGYRAFAIADLKTATGTFAVRAAGDCRSVATVASASLRAQACSLQVKSGAKGGLITSNGLIRVGEPASAANSGIWTFALFGAPPAA